MTDSHSTMTHGTPEQIHRGGSSCDESKYARYRKLRLDATKSHKQIPFRKQHTFPAYTRYPEKLLQVVAITRKPERLD